MTYSAVARPICLRLFLHCVETACDLALTKAGRSMAARMAMMAMTTSNSINVKPLWDVCFISLQLLILHSVCLRVCGERAGISILCQALGFMD